MIASVASGAPAEASDTMRSSADPEYAETESAGAIHRGRFDCATSSP